MYQKPKTAKRLWWDVIPRAVDEYHQQLRAFPGQPIEAQVANPVWHIHGGKVPESHMVVSFSMLLNLASVAGAKDAAGLWGFIRKYAPEASPETNPRPRCRGGLCDRAISTTRSRRRGRYRLPTDEERAAIEDLRARLVNWDGPADEEALQNICLCRGPRARVRAAARLVQGALRGAARARAQGPRFGGFIALYGVDETVALIDRALSGHLAG